MQQTPTLAGGYVRRESIVEVAGYLGAAISLTAAGVVLGDSASAAVQIAFDAITAAVLVVAGVVLTGGSEPYRRMKSVLWFLSVFLVADLASEVFGRVVDLSNARTVVILVGLVAAAYAFVLWVNSQRSLQVVALVLSTHVAVVGLSFQFPGVGGFLFGPPDVSGLALATWLFGWGLVTLGGLGILTPRRTTMVLGSIGAVLGPLLFLATNNDVIGEILAIASAVVLVFIGDVADDRAVKGLAIAGLLIVGTAIVQHHVSDQGPAIAVLVFGLALLAAALATARAPGGPSGPAVSAWGSASGPSPGTGWPTPASDQPPSAPDQPPSAQTPSPQPPPEPPD
jgi:hypothetical protein